MEESEILEHHNSHALFTGKYKYLVLSEFIAAAY